MSSTKIMLYTDIRNKKFDTLQSLIPDLHKQQLRVFQAHKKLQWMHPFAALQRNSHISLFSTAELIRYFEDVQSRKPIKHFLKNAMKINRMPGNSVLKSSLALARCCCERMCR